MAKKKSNPETQVITLDQVDVNKLPELQGWREKLIAIDKENPVIKEIKNHKTYEKAKKHRHNRRQGRYEVQNSDKNIVSRLNEIKNESKTIHTELIYIVLSGEEEQDKFIKDYEAKKEQERLEKERKEQERKDKIKEEINLFYSDWKAVLSEMEFNEIEDAKKTIVAQLEEKDEKDFEEFQEDFNEKVTLLREQFKERSAYLKQQEEDRIAREKLAEEKAELARKEKEKYERDQKRNNEMQPYIVFIRNYPAMLEMDEETYQEQLAAIKKGAEFEWKCQREEREKRDAEAEKLRKERAELEAEKKRIADAKAEADRNNPILPNTIFNKKREEAKAEFEKEFPLTPDQAFKPADEQLVEEWDKAKTHEKPAQIKIDGEWSSDYFDATAKEQEVVEPETVETEEELEVWDLPEETPKQIADKIEALAWEIRNDFSDPRSECRRIVDLCEKLRQLL